MERREKLVARISGVNFEEDGTTSSVHLVDKAIEVREGYALRHPEPDEWHQVGNGD